MHIPALWKVLLLKCDPQDQQHEHCSKLVGHAGSQAPPRSVESGSAFPQAFQVISMYIQVWEVLWPEKLSTRELSLPVMCPTSHGRDPWLWGKDYYWFLSCSLCIKMRKAAWGRREQEIVLSGRAHILQCVRTQVPAPAHHIRALCKREASQVVEECLSFSVCQGHFRHKTPGEPFWQNKKAG